MNAAVEGIIALLRAWQPLPKYSVERRIDVWLAPFLAPYLSSKLGGTVELVAAEFPLRKKKQGNGALTVNADFLLHRTAPRGSRDPARWILVELKTDGGSVRLDQLAEYFKEVDGPAGPVRWTMAEILAGLEHVAKKTDARFRTGYRQIIRNVKRARDASAEVHVLCVGPTKPDHAGIRCLGLRKLTHWKPDGADQRALWAALTPLLRGIARSDKARRAA